MEIRMMPGLLLVVFVAMPFCVNIAEAVFDDKGQLPSDDLYYPGDIVLGALVRLYFPEAGMLCGSHNLSSPGVQAAAAINFTINRINANRSILPNHKLGVAIMNDCDRPSVALARASKFIPLESCFQNQCGGSASASYPVVGVMGPYSSAMSVPVASLLGLYQIPVMSWSATSPELSRSDKRKDTRFKYFARAIPSDEHMVEAMVALLLKFRWTYVSTLHAVGSNEAARVFRRRTKKAKICIALEHELSHDDTEADYDMVLHKLQSKITNKTGARLVVVFLDGRTSENLLLALQRNNASRDFIFIGNDGFQPNLAKAVDAILPIKAFTFNIRSSDPEFAEFYAKQSPYRVAGNPWIGEFTPEELGCTWNPAPGGERCRSDLTMRDVKSHKPYNGIGRVTNIVKTYAWALHDLIQDRCPGERDPQRLHTCIEGKLLFSYMTNTSFESQDSLIEYDEKGDVYGDYIASFTWGNDQPKYVQQLTELHSGNVRIAKLLNRSRTYNEVDFGKWNRKTQNLSVSWNLLLWAKDTLPRADNMSGTKESLPESVCSKPCSVGQYEVKGELECCWECKDCRKNEIVNENISSCIACNSTYWPHEVHRNVCVAIEPEYMPLSSLGISCTLFLLATLGLVSVAVITGLFIHHWERKVVKGCTRELMVPIMIGLTMAYFTVFALILPPTTPTCYISYAGLNLSCCLIFGPLFLKTKRLHMIFQASDKCKKRVKLADSKSMVLGLFFLVSIQIALMVIMIALSFNYNHHIQVVNEMPISMERSVERRCRLEPQVLLVPLSYNIVLLLLCAVYGFLTRKLPENYNESWYIFIAVTTTIFVWVASIPTYFVAFYAQYQVSLLSMTLIVNGVVISVCLFVPKIYAVYNVPERDIRISRLGSRRLSIGVGMSDSSSTMK